MNIINNKPVSSLVFQKHLIKRFHRLLDLLDKNLIDYSLAYGTMLGAVREKRMIEWDLDIDIFVNDENVYKIEGILDDDMNFRTFLRNDCFYGESRVYFEDLLMYRPNKKENPIENAHVDIYHYRNVTFSNNLKPRTFTSINSLLLFYNIRNDKDFSKILIKKIIKKILIPFLPNNSLVRRKMNRYHQKYDVEDASSFMVLEIVESLKRYPDYTGEYILVPFDGRECKVFNNYKEFLIVSYGKDYMIPFNDGRSSNVEFFICDKK